MLGFVEAPGLPNWPARLEYETSGMMKVVFFGTGESKVINKTNWIPYTSKAFKKVDTTKNKRRSGAFKVGLQELQAAVLDLEENKENTKENKKTSNKAKEDKKVKATGLRKEQLENERKFKETMIEKQHGRQWECSRCEFKTGFSYKAKQHAIVCTSMLRARKHRNKNYSCLKCTDGETFRNKKELRAHTKTKHGSQNSFICVDCKKKIQSRSAYIRHRKEKHPEAGLSARQFPCAVCQKTFKRNHDLSIHIGRIHPKYKLAKDIILEVINNVKSKSLDKNDSINTPAANSHVQNNNDQETDDNTDANFHVQNNNDQEKNDNTDANSRVQNNNDQNKDDVNVSDEEVVNFQADNDFDETDFRVEDDFDDRNKLVTYHDLDSDRESHVQDDKMDCQGDVVKPSSNVRFIIGDTMCAKEIEIEKRKTEFLAKFRNALADDYKAEKEEDIRKARKAETRKRKIADKKAAACDQPKRKSSRLESTQFKQNKESGKLIVTQVLEEIIDAVDITKNKSANGDFTEENYHNQELFRHVGNIIIYEEEVREVSGSIGEETVLEEGGPSDREEVLEVGGSSGEGELLVVGGSSDKGEVVEVASPSGEREVLKEGGLNIEDQVLDVAGPSVKSNQEKNKFKCPQCPDSFKTKSKMSLHIFRMHEVKLPSPVCHRTWCNKEFNTKYERNKHSDTCFLVCPSCSKTFIREDRFKMHKRAEEKMSSRLSFML